MAGYVVQSAQGTATASPGTVTLAGATRAGNTLIAMASVRNAGSSNGTLSTVTLGGAADNFAQAASFGSGTGPAQLYWWLDPLCAGGGTTVIFTTTGGAGAEALTMSVLEVGGMIPIPAGAGAVDASSGSVTAAGSAIWNSGTVLSGWPTEIWTGLVAAAGTHTVTGPGYPWVNLTSQPNGTISITEAGYQLTPNLGTVSFSGTFSVAQGYAAGAVTFPAMAFSPALPDYPAGYGPQQGDMLTLATAPLGFTQQKVVFRAAQLTTTTTLPSGSPGAATAIQFDTIYEDPYQGWNPSAFTWTAPFTGWYQVTYTISVGTCPTDAILAAGNGISGLIMPSTGGIVQATIPIFLVGGLTANAFHAHVWSGSNVSTSNSPGSTAEIIWLGFSAS